MGSAGVPLRFAAVPVVFWFSVGNVQFVSVPEAGVPNTGATKVIPDAKVPTVTFAAATEPAEPVVFWFSVGNVQFVRTPDAGVPNAGATSA